MTATKVNLSEMVDLAVGTPEVGVVNCNRLRHNINFIMTFCVSHLLKK